MIHMSCQKTSRTQTRRANGEELLPEEDPTLFKPTPEPSLLDNYLVTSQVCVWES